MKFPELPSIVKVHIAGLMVVGIMLVWQDAHSAQWWGEYHVGSNHSERYYRDTDGTLKEFNERNTGGGISYAISEHAELGAGFFRNSFNKTSVYAGIDVHTSTHRAVRVGVSLAPVTGYQNTPAVTHWMILPNVVFGNNKVRTKVGIMPIGEVKFMTLTVGIGF